MNPGVTAATIATSTSATTAVIANAIKASGAIVRVEPEAFLEVLARAETPLVIVNEQRMFFRLNHQYLTSYRGFIVLTKSPVPLTLPDWCEVINARSVWVPM